MKGSSIYIDLLKVFSDIAKAKSFSKAAELNFISQSAVSQQILFLENHFDKQLIIRGRGKFSLTHEGRIFLNGCHSILDLFQETVDLMDAKLGKTKQTVNIETIYSIGFYRLPRCIKQFMSENKNINLHIEYSRSDKIYNNVIQGDCDIGITAYPWNHPLIDIQYVKNEKLVAVCAPSFHLSTNLKISIKELNNLEFISFTHEIPTRSYIDSILKDNNIAVNHLHEFDNIETLKRSLEIGNGMAILPENTIVQEISNNDLVSIELAEGPFFRKIGVITRKDRPQSKTIKKIVKFLNKL
ncbi:MAG: LysR family transcriptional regulator [Candidatus Marinimicrobia bacterium]|nr:LysR family transcriptional regulator [Candidatus Neomarinimicrobiota bacterium]MBT7378183.1 LysR family transcriptional regulator [Candidatus Neomarinimicrobiota bacterium]